MPEVIDSHLHLVTAAMFRRLQDRPWPLRPQARAKLLSDSSRWTQRMQALESVTLTQQAEMWTRAFDRAGIATG